jgi:hypothetical protein
MVYVGYVGQSALGHIFLFPVLGGFPLKNLLI